MTNRRKTLFESVSGQQSRIDPIIHSDFLKHIRLGSHKLAGKNYAGAITEYTLAIQIERDNFLGYLSRGNVMLEIENFDAAITDFQKSIVLNPYNLESRDMYKAAVLRRDFHEGISINMISISFLMPYWRDGMLCHASVGGNKDEKRQNMSDNSGNKCLLISDPTTRAM